MLEQLLPVSCFLNVWHLAYCRLGSCLLKLVPIFEHKVAIQVLRDRTLACCMDNGQQELRLVPPQQTASKIHRFPFPNSEERIPSPSEFASPRPWQSYSFGRLLAHLSKALAKPSLGLRTYRRPLCCHIVCRSDWSRSCRRQHLRKRMQSHAADVHSTAIPASKAAPPKMHGKAQKLLMTIVRQLQNVDMIAAKRVKSDTRQRLGHKHPNIPHRSETHATNTECEAILNQHPHQPVQVQ